MDMELTTRLAGGSRGACAERTFVPNALL